MARSSKRTASDDRPAAVSRRLASSAWHGRPSWGRRTVRAYPLVAVLAAAALAVPATLTAQRAATALPGITGTRGATLTGVTAGSIAADSTVTRADGPAGVLVFSRPGLANVPIQGSTSLAIPSYLGWEANGSDPQGYAYVKAGHLFVGDRLPTRAFRGYFLTATAPTADSCAFHFWADPPPPLPAAARGNPNAEGELVVAVQTSDTIRTGDINYVYVTEDVYPAGVNKMSAGFAIGHVTNAVSHPLRSAPWPSDAPLHIVIQTNGSNQLTVWINGMRFYSANHLNMGIAPAFEAYLEVQAVGTPYRVSFTRYASICGHDLVIGGLPDGSTVTLGALSATAQSHTAVLPLPAYLGPASGNLVVNEPSGTVVTFPGRLYWPGDRLTFTQPS